MNYAFLSLLAALAGACFLIDRRNKRIAELTQDSDLHDGLEHIVALAEHASRSDANHEKANQSYDELKRADAALLERLGIGAPAESNPKGNSGPR